ncbi:peptidylprolyl isomerase [Clostridioides mangenotii]|uniref:peptidylprolyl isomerase n=1 Tax=Metaclostridioides mangenotii TaxID=1540 RepID=UPI002149DAD0|nr:peptidylprolyl isomerase [Clostridioides mangenotii]MCR1953734.1 peptidylprolyl isomerase [Clostridioides mangenotii]
MEKKVLATVGEKEITNLDIDSALRTMDQYQAMHFGTEEGKKQLLEDLINQELFYLEAVEDELDKEEAFLVELEKVKVNLLKQIAISKVLSGVKLTQDEKLAFFEENKNNFAKPETASAKHILVDSEDKANEILSQIKSGDVSFEDAAKQHSTCPSNEAGGDLGSFSRGQMVPEFEEVVFTMNKGEVSEPVKTQFGYHLIQLDDVQPGGESTFEEVEGEIEKNLMYQKQNQVYGEKLASLKAKYGNLISHKE